MTDSGFKIDGTHVGICLGIGFMTAPITSAVTTGSTPPVAATAIAVGVGAVTALVSNGFRQKREKDEPPES